MSYRRTPFAIGEFYHCYTRGIDKRITFEDTHDYERFLQALYVCNDEEMFHRDSLSNTSHHSLLCLDRGKPLVSIIAYCLMPNHYHLLLHEITENGIARFMQKIGTMYTMYFNAKNARVGSLFIGPFRSRHITEDTYLNRVIPYIHLNPAELFEPDWKKGIVRKLPELTKELKSYRFSSLPDYYNTIRPENSILDSKIIHTVQNPLPAFSKILKETIEYYRDLKW